MEQEAKGAGSSALGREERKERGNEEKGKENGKKKRKKRERRERKREREREREREIRTEITASIAEPIGRVPRSPACADEATGKGVEMLEIGRLEQGKILGIRADFELNDGTLGFENNYRTI